MVIFNLRFRSKPTPTPYIFENMNRSFDKSDIGLMNQHQSQRKKNVEPREL